MDLWIRSQSKGSLIKVNNLVIIDGNSIANLGSEYDLEFRIELATYKTKERTLEVLDEIQNILRPKISVQPIIEEDINPKYIHKHFVSNGKEVDIVEFNTYVYQMPIE